MRYRTKLPRAVPLINNLVTCLFLTHEDCRASRANISLKICCSCYISHPAFVCGARGQRARFILGQVCIVWESGEEPAAAPLVLVFNVQHRARVCQLEDLSAKTSRELTCTSDSRLNRGCSLFQYTLKEPQLNFPVVRNHCLQSCWGIDLLVLNVVWQTENPSDCTD